MQTTNSSAIDLAAPGVALVDFTVEWCAPCQVMLPVLDGLAGQYAGRGHYVNSASR